MDQTHIQTGPASVHNFLMELNSQKKKQNKIK